MLPFGAHLMSIQLSMFIIHLSLPEICPTQIDIGSLLILVGPSELHASDASRKPDFSMFE